MKCSNCGKDVPFLGNVCPYCHIDKSRDKAMMTWGMIGGIVGAIIGTAVAPCIGTAIGVFVGALLLMPMALFTTSKPKQVHLPPMPSPAPVVLQTYLVCAGCNTPLAPGSAFCNRCGRPAATAPPPLPFHAPSLPPPVQSRPNRAVRLVFLVLVASTAAMVGIGMLGAYLGSRDANTAAPSSSGTGPLALRPAPPASAARRSSRVDSTNSAVGDEELAAAQQHLANAAARQKSAWAHVARRLQASMPYAAARKEQATAEARLKLLKPGRDDAAIRTTRNQIKTAEKRANSLGPAHK